MQLPFVNDLQGFESVLPTPVRVGATSKYTGKGITIAFLDSGFYPHDDLIKPANRIEYFADARPEQVRENTGFSRPHVTSWHGTMVACVCAGNGFTSAYRYASLAPDACAVLVKTGNLHDRRIREADIWRALRWTIDNAKRWNVRVVNISVGGDFPSIGKLTPLDLLVEEGVTSGLVIICASGNSGAKRIIPPASAPGAITVGGLNDHNTLDRSRHSMYHSSFGRGARGVTKPELIAPAQWVAAPMLPHTKTYHEAQFLWQLERANDKALARLLRTPEAGVRIRSETLRRPLSEIRLVVRERMNDQKLIHPNYQHVDGTSFAAPIVSSVVAQMLEADPALTPRQVKQILIQTAVPLGDVAIERQGAGAVDAGAAVEATLRMRARASRDLAHRANGVGQASGLRM